MVVFFDDDGNDHGGGSGGGHGSSSGGSSRSGSDASPEDEVTYQYSAWSCVPRVLPGQYSCRCVRSSRVSVSWRSGYSYRGVRLFVPVFHVKHRWQAVPVPAVHGCGGRGRCVVLLWASFSPPAGLACCERIIAGGRSPRANSDQVVSGMDSEE